jgi:DNA polymerase V
MSAIVGTQLAQTLVALTAAHYTVLMSSIDARTPNLVRVGRDPGADPGSTRASVAIGFGSPSGDTGVTRLDLNDILVRHPQATFLMRITGDAMREVGIDSADLVLIDRAIPPTHGHVVIAVVDEEFVCRQLCKQGADIRLQATRAGCADILARDGEGFQIWGVVTQVIKSMPV